MPVIPSGGVQRGMCACLTTRGASLTAQQQPAAALCQQHAKFTFSCHTDRNEDMPNNQRRFINPHIGSQLLRFAVQRAVRSMEVAHRLWDLMREQRSKVSRVSLRTYLIAMQRRDINNPRVAQVCLPSFNVPAH